MSAYQFRVSRKLTGLVVRSDADHPHLYRLHYRGRVSDTVNLTRAKDAAISWVRPVGGISQLDAKWEPCK